MVDSCFSILNQALLEPQIKLIAEIFSLTKDLNQQDLLQGQRLQQCSQELAHQERQHRDAVEKLHQMQIHLAQMEKMALLGQMVSGIAHEINNPITFIYGNLPYIEEHVQDLLRVVQAYQNSPDAAMLHHVLEPEELDFVLDDLPRIVDSMKLGANRVRELVLTLRNFYRLDEAEMKAADLHEGIENTLILLRHRYKQDIQIVREFGNIPPIECHINQLNQVFMNLLGNAIDALLMQSDAISDKQITITTAPLNSDWIAVNIADNGPGISIEIQQRLFEPFFTTKPMGIGTGLGLSISHQIITETHGGKIYCCSALGEGTTFRVELPIHQPTKVSLSDEQPISQSQI